MTDLERFEQLVERIPFHPCWEWIGFRNKGGYGRMMLQKKPIGAHRFSYQAFKGEIPAGLDIDHLCRNRGCVNPYHLEAVTRRENLRRSPITFHRGGATTAALKRATTHCPQGHPYSFENTRVRSNGHRDCNACNRDRVRQNYWIKKARA